MSTLRVTFMWTCSECEHSFHAEQTTFAPEGCPECASQDIRRAGSPRTEPSYDDSREVTGRGEY